MKPLWFALAFSFGMISMQGQDSVKLYNPGADAASELNAAIQKANAEDKHVLIQVGGNWCRWCIMLHQFIESNSRLDSIIAADYILLRINYSKENRNLETLAKLDFPQRFGFPVLVVLDPAGKRIHTQDTGLLEKDNAYDAEKIERFLLSWNKNAVDPDTYTKKQKYSSGFQYLCIVCITCGKT